ncbi:unnamed protein product [Brachionus calyciflorus]|uniref:Transporter n=1 Tax=Brachionus calyciflorus TaxID=104777 RepID=A0A813Z1W0_9BILA|nr:unnamed protein product [Brachionus calyciflorus]
MESENIESKPSESPDTFSRKSSRRNSKNSNKIHPFKIESNDTKIENTPNLEAQKKVDEEEEDDEERANWTGKLDFFLSALSYSVGLGAVWRFPYLCYKSGGGAFLIPFFIFMILIGVPIMYLELSVGQFTSRGPILSWVMVPLFKGVGISMNIINNYVNIYYIMIIGYSLYYLLLSLNSTLPWEKCNPKWASINCVDDFSSENFTFTNCEDKNKFFKCDDGKCYVSQIIGGLNLTCNSPNKVSVGYWNPIYPSQDYWNNVILKKSATINETGTLVWQLVVALFLAWIVCFLCLFRGVKLSGKIVYFTALFPYLVLFILGIRGWTLDGAEIGLSYYIKPDLSKLTESTVWRDAAVQVFFTLSLSYGGLIALSSYNKYNHNILRDTLILSVSNFLTCILAGLVVFAYMGSLSKTTGLSMDKVVQSGQGLVYVVYPFAATTLSAAPVWAIMFFIMMLALGMGTMMASVETLTTSLEDFFPVLKKTQKIKAFTLGVVCLIYFLIGLILCSQAGTYWIELLDEYSANWAILLIALVECISVGWFYGVNNFRIDISTMIPKESTFMHKLNSILFVWFKICWMFLTPILLLGLTIFAWVDSGPIESSEYTFPNWTNIFGHFLSASSLTGIIGWMIYAYINTRYFTREPLRNLIKRDKAWRPAKDRNNKKVIEAYQRPHTHLRGNVAMLD